MMEIQLHGLRLGIVDSGLDPAFEIFFSGYDRAFVLPDEKEDIAGFRACLALNHGPDHERLTALYGPFRELCVTAWRDDAFVGGANFIAMPLAPGVVSANLNYIYIAPSQRRRGYLGQLLKAIDELMGTMFAGARNADRLIFIEQNDPLRMSREDYERDTQLTGLDQFDRLRIWAGLGARLVDFAYVQPALSAEQQPDENLLYSVLGAPHSRLEPGVLSEHLRHFFGISVLKGTSLADDPTAAKQLASLRVLAEQGQVIQLLDPSPALALDPEHRTAAFRDGCGFRKLVRASAGW